MTVKQENIYLRKLRGGYYTPAPLAEFICRWAITDPTQQILEPSCGDGNFIEAAIKRFNDLGVKGKKLHGQIKGIELSVDEAAKARDRAYALGLNSNTIEQTDFFTFLEQQKKDALYDAVIGNPPFIRYQDFPEEHRAKAFDQMNRMGLSPNKLTNIWVPFLVLSASVLKDSGKLGMVIPAELFQVNYAAETRIFLSNFFQRITIITFEKLVFENIQQEVVLLLCEKNVVDNPGIRVVEVKAEDDLNSIDLGSVHRSAIKELEHNSEKWTKYFLEASDIILLRNLKADDRINRCGNIVDVDVGLVTGRNEFFMVSKSVAKEWDISKYTIPVVSRSVQLAGLTFDAADQKQNDRLEHEGHMFLPPNEDFKELPDPCKKYIKWGEKSEFHTGYKTRIRKRWYITPSVWKPDLFFLRQVGDYPKCVVNETNASSTDTIHRGRIIQTDVAPALISLSFMNSLTFAFSEITGRSYGGGVLTFEPTEIEQLPLPLLPHNHTINIKEIDALVRERKIDEVLDIIDQHLLIAHLGFEKEVVAQLRKIWRKLSQRRQNRK